MKTSMIPADKMPAVIDNKYCEHPVQMNLELTTACPLHCPQCYVHLNTGREMPLETALYWIRDAAEAGISEVNLSGGETMCYPHLTELIRECHKLGLESNIALSGVYVTEKKLGEFIDAGVTRIFVSLNGSTKAVNEKTRDGYELAISTLEMLRDMEWENTVINWVMHEYNADDFPNMIALAERYNVSTLVILSFKPDSAHQLGSYPTSEQIRTVARQIREYKGTVDITAESCFSQLRTLAAKSFFGSLNYGVFRGCGAGRNGISVSVEGKLTPCRHIEIEEEYDHIMEYWNQSEFLAKLRTVEDSRKEPCKGCKWEKNCLPCQAVGLKLHNELNYGMQECTATEAADE